VVYAIVQFGSLERAIGCCKLIIISVKFECLYFILFYVIIFIFI